MISMSTEYKDWYADLSEKQKKIYNICMEYPFLIQRDIDGNRDEEFNYEYLDLEIPTGWKRLFFQMCADIKPLLEKEGVLDDFYFLQVKEKFNMLRCYSNGVASQEVEDIIAKYEMMAYYVCTNCGKPATYETQGYFASYCGECCKNFIKPPKMKPIEFEPEFKISGFSKGKHYEKTISFENEWNRYLKGLKDNGV